MQAPLKILTALGLTLTVLAVLPSAAQQAPKGKAAEPKSKAPAKGAAQAPPAKVGAPKPDDTKEKAAATPAVPSNPAPTLSPEEQQHIQRFDAAIAKAR